MGSLGLNWDMNGRRTQGRRKFVVLLTFLLFYPGTLFLLGTDWVTPHFLAVSLDCVLAGLLFVALVWYEQHPTKRS